MNTCSNCSFPTLSVFFCALIQINCVFATEKLDIDHYQGQLDTVYEGISKVQDNLKSTRLKHGHIITELQLLESSISKNARKLKNSGNEIKQLKKRIKKLSAEQKTLKKKLKIQRNVLADQVRAAYTMGNQQHIKMLLNQQNPDTLGQVQIYFDYMNRAREQEITAFMTTIKHKIQVEIDIDATLTKHITRLAHHKKQKKTLAIQRAKRSQLLAKLEIDIQNQELTLSDLESSRSRIENLLMSLGELLADIPPNPNDNQPFSTQKGRLPWPVKGPFLARYGRSKNHGGLKWKGVLISTKYGTPVRAVSHGRVAFSDWLQGYGFISIVDHGDGYMSLYGHNETLFKQAGDWVNAGEVIATTGDSGGQPLPGLYFEIRSKGKPVNPDSWCSKSAQHT